MRPVNIFIVVVFPAPFGPRKPMHLLPSSLRLRLETAANDPNDFERFTASIEGPDMLSDPLLDYLSKYVEGGSGSRDHEDRGQLAGSELNGFGP
jgi:hypothetical protein